MPKERVSQLSLFLYPVKANKKRPVNQVFLSEFQASIMAAAMGVGSTAGELPEVITIHSIKIKYTIIISTVINRAAFAVEPVLFRPKVRTPAAAIKTSTAPARVI